MPTRSAPVQINQFVGGLNTEGNPLNYPINASIDELNMDIKSNGTRLQRFGMDVEDNSLNINTDVQARTSTYGGRSQYRWYNPGGDSSKQFLVVQLGNYFAIHGIDGGVSISSDRKYYNTLDSGTYSYNWSYAVVDGLLVIATGDTSVTIVEYNPTTQGFTENSDRLKIRDFFGVAATQGGSNLWEQENLALRVAAPNYPHVYNLRNGTFGLPRLKDVDDAVKYDPIDQFRFATGNSSFLAPSMADSVTPFFYARTSYTNLPTSDRYNTNDAFKYTPSNVNSPKGRFVIDALDRGASRRTAMTFLYLRNPELTYGASYAGDGFINWTPNTDRTEGGVSVVAEYAGRAWFAGFSSNTTGPEQTSPGMSSYVLFSQVVSGKEQIPRCYQVADPTDPYDNEIVSTDGGYVKLSGAYDIKHMLNMGPYLFVFARNGVWQISGIDSNIFDATSFSASKISDYSCISGNSVVQVGSDAFFWGEEGIYLLTIDQVSGQYRVNDASETTIKTFYEGIPNDDKRAVSGYYDIRNNSVRWLYGSGEAFQGGSKELVFNIKYATYLPMSITSISGVVNGPITSAGGFPLVTDITENVTSNGVQVTSLGQPVTITNEDVELASDNSFYCIVITVNPSITYTFGGYEESTHFDWTSYTPTLADAYIQTGPVSGGDGDTRKSIMYITTHIPNGGTSGYSCLGTVKWGWSTDITTGRWTTQRRYYRYNSHYDNHDIVSNRNKVRGGGTAVSIRFENDGVAPLALYGWEYDLGANQKE